MKTHKPSIRFWTVLGVINALAMLYPIQLVRLASSVEDSFFATVVVVAAVFMLTIIDMVSILLAYSFSGHSI